MTLVTESSILTLTLSEETTGRTGRVFVRTAAFQHRTLAELTQAVQDSFELHFDDEDDAARLELINAALRREVELPVELYPTESAPARWEAFLRFRVEPNEPPESISGCMIFPMAAVVERLGRAPHWFTESSVVQVVDDAGSDVEVAAALQLWVKRIWPDISPPIFHIDRWPHVSTH